jgi:23S rRNA (adenine2030-N6)-methyltransferase
MNYRHSFHAGNFADVFKHSLLILLLEALRHKDSAFFYLDAHGGRGRYDLHSDEAQRTGEYHEGIKRLWSVENPPAAIETLCAQVRAINAAGDLRYYPGSPRLARTLLRPCDRMLALELHPQEYAVLAAEFSRDPQVKIYHQDAWQGLRAYLPPLQRRGLVLLDAPFEQRDEFQHLVQGLQHALKRWAHGIYALWYPIKEHAPIARFYRQLHALDVDILSAELHLDPADNPHLLNGCGMAIINPPWRMAEHLRTLLPWLAQHLHRQRPAQWYVNEASTHRMQ